MAVMMISYLEARGMGKLDVVILLVFIGLILKKRKKLCERVQDVGLSENGRISKTY